MYIVWVVSRPADGLQRFALVYAPHVSILKPPFPCTQVDPQAFDTLVECVTQGNYDTCESIGQGDPSGKLVNPLGGISVDLAGPAG